MRLEPIEKPKGLMMRIAYWMTRRQLGKVMTPMKVVYGRMPGAVKLSYEIAKFEMKGILLDPELKFLVTNLAAQINGCGFCLDIGRAMAIREHLGMEKFNCSWNTGPARSSPIGSAGRWLMWRKPLATSASPTPPSRRCGNTSTIEKSSRSHG
jgi:hypothetical protein